MHKQSNAFHGNTKVLGHAWGPSCAQGVSRASPRNLAIVQRSGCRRKKKSLWSFFSLDSDSQVKLGRRQGVSASCCGLGRTTETESETAAANLSNLAVEENCRVTMLKLISLAFPELSPQIRHFLWAFVGVLLLVFTCQCVRLLLLLLLLLSFFITFFFNYDHENNNNFLACYGSGSYSYWKCNPIYQLFLSLQFTNIMKFMGEYLASPCSIWRAIQLVGWQ